MSHGQLWKATTKGAYTPDATEVFFGTSFKNATVKAMAYNVRCCRYTRESSTNDGDLGSLELRMGWRGSWREDLVKDPLEELVCEEDGTLNYVQDQAS